MHSLDELSNKYTYEHIWLEKIKKDPSFITKAPIQRESLSIAAIRNNWIYYRCIKKKTFKIWYETIRNYNNDCVREKAPSIYEIPKEYWRTKLLKLIVKKLNVYQMENVPIIFYKENILLTALQNNIYLIGRIPEKYLTEKICISLVKHKHLNLRLLNDKLQTKNVCIAALKASIHNFMYIINQITEESKEYKNMILTNLNIHFIKDLSNIIYTYYDPKYEYSEYIYQNYDLVYYFFYNKDHKEYTCSLFKKMYENDWTSRLERNKTYGFFGPRGQGKTMCCTNLTRLNKMLNLCKKTK